MATAVSDWGQPTWKLIFNAGSQLHGADSPFLWGPARKSPKTSCSLAALTPSKAPNNMTIANIMKDWYLGFVLNLDPNSVSNSGTPKPYWPQYQTLDVANFTVMDVNYTQIGAIPDMDASARCDFFHSQSYVARN